MGAYRWFVVFGVVVLVLMSVAALVEAVREARRRG